jgi:acyl-[acyl-carrier-protein]-phospholipid O-acyltransferase/long-chain-fatty-acid--[acyl-carrier-protein] ligase
MISLGAVETDGAAALAGGFPRGSRRRADRRKGERIVLVTTKMPALREELRDYSRRFGATELMIPNEIINVPQTALAGLGQDRLRDRPEDCRRMGQDPSRRQGANDRDCPA